MWYKQILLLSVIILLVDILWLTYGVNKLWQENVQAVQKSPMVIRKHYALLSYILIILGIWYFVLQNINKETSVKQILLSSFLFGFILYGVFDFTNLAIFKDFQLKTALIDMVWGGILTSIAVYFTNSWLSSQQN